MAGGWNSDSNLTYQAYSGAYGGRRINLKYPEYQPFAGYGWFPENTTLSHCYNDVAEGHPFWQPLNKDFPILSTALLCDYLDYDNVPLSLCIPCTEAVPMICGVELNDDCVKYSVSMAENELAPANPDAGIKKKDGKAGFPSCVYGVIFCVRDNCFCRGPRCGRNDNGGDGWPVAG